MTQQCERKPKNCARPGAARILSRIRMWPTVAAFGLLAGLLGPYVAFSQQPAGLDAEVQGRAIIRHLSAVIQFYRAVNQPIQKAGEPNDVVYRDQEVTQASEIAAFAFQSAKAEAALIAGYQGTAQEAAPTSSEQQRMQATEATVEGRITDLQNRESALDKQMATARPSTLAALASEKKQVQAALELEHAMKDALQRIVGMSSAAGGTGLAADIVRLQSSVPELQSKNKTSVPELTTIQSAMSAGVISQGSVLFELLETRHALASLIEENDQLHRQAQALRTPMQNILRGLIQQGQQLSAQTEVPAPTAAAKTGRGHRAAAVSALAPARVPVPGNLESITARFKTIAAATVPLSQEVIVLEQSHGNLAAWEMSVDREYASILHTLLLRIFVIAIALGVIVGAGEIWTRATNKYIRDLRRRRQLLIVRRVVVGFLSAIVVLFGFVTQFNSLATFAGFITAGIAVGLQTILLSVAAYFFIIGRYGIKVGDRITIASVTGDVIDVGLVRFYLMELAGAGPELNPTGRVAVFSNAVLFQAGTPLYKQVPGTGYAWHELTVKLADGADFRMTGDAIVQSIHRVYEGYRASVEHEHKGMQNWMQTSIDTPEIQSRLQFSGAVLQLWVRFPVQISKAGETDEQVTQALVELMAANPAIKSAVAATPTIQASVRG